MRDNNHISQRIGARRVEKPEYKEKLRLRAYGAAAGDSPAFVELKKKFGGIVYKRRISMPLSEAEKYLFYGIRPREDGQILREIDYILRRYELKPASFSKYGTYYLKELCQTCFPVDREGIVTKNYAMEGRKYA